MAGVLLEAFGGPNTFYGTAVVAALTGLYYFLTQHYIRSKEQQNGKRQPPIANQYQAGLVVQHATGCNPSCGMHYQETSILILLFF